MISNPSLLCLIYKKKSDILVQDILVIGNVQLDNFLKPHKLSHQQHLAGKRSLPFYISLPWRHNERHGVSNHWRQDCLLNRFFQTQIMWKDRWIPRTKGQLRGKCFNLMTSSCFKIQNDVQDGRQHQGLKMMGISCNLFTDFGNLFVLICFFFWDSVEIFLEIYESRIVMICQLESTLVPHINENVPENDKIWY